MPELPEVETIRNELYPRVVGKRIARIIIKDEKPVRNPLDEFAINVTGQKINDLVRRGKYLIFKLENGNNMVMHLRMTGAVFVDPDGDGKYDRVIFELDDKSRMVFSDRRRLGVVWFTGDIKEVENKLGPEPLTSDFSAPVFRKRLKGRNAPVKAVLLDQKIIAGVGNMYADEALFAAGIHPEKEAGKLTGREVNRLYEAVITVLSKAIENKGASVDTYQRPDGARGTAHETFNVAHQRNKKCPRCGSPIERIVVRGRGTYMCPKCQKK